MQARIEAGSPMILRKVLSIKEQNNTECHAPYRCQAEGPSRRCRVAMKECNCESAERPYRRYDDQRPGIQEWPKIVASAANRGPGMGIDLNGDQRGDGYGEDQEPYPEPLVSHHMLPGSADGRFPLPRIDLGPSRHSFGSGRGSHQCGCQVNENRSGIFSKKSTFQVNSLGHSVSEGQANGGAALRLLTVIDAHAAFGRFTSLA